MPNPHPATATPDDQSRHVLTFDANEDHCRYDAQTILKGLDADDRATITAVCGAATPEWTTTVDLYIAADELEEAGHDDLALHVTQHNHDESLYGCLCRSEALDRFKDQVGDVLDDIVLTSPAGTWWTGHRAYAHGLDVDELLSDADWDDSGTVTFNLDRFGNGTVVTDQATLRLVGFTIPELGTFVQHLDAGDIRVDDDGEYATVEHWLALPEQVRHLAAAVHHHDVRVSPGTIPGWDREVRSQDLHLAHLRFLADLIVALPSGIADTVPPLLGNLHSTLDELLDALRAAAD